MPQNSLGIINDTKIISGKAASMLIDTLLDIEEDLFKYMNRDLGLKVTKKTKIKLLEQESCHICGLALADERKDKDGNVIPIVRDHVCKCFY